MTKEGIVCPVHKLAESSPDSLALVNENASLSYGELEERIHRCAIGLHDLGIETGDRIAVIAQNSVEYAILIFAAYRIGATLAPINTRLDPRSWEDCIMKLTPSALVIDRERIAFADDIGMRYLLMEDVGGGIGSEPYSADSFSVLHEVSTEHEASIVFTSGSSGDPKGVILTLGNHFCNALASNENIKLTHQDCWLAALPFCHVGGMSILFRTALDGCSAYVADSFAPDVVNRLIDRGQLTHLSLVPTMLDSLLASRKMRKFPDSLRAILLGGAAVSERLIETIRELNLPVLPTYGLTEAASQLCTLSPESPPEKLSSSGSPLENTELKIVDDEDETVESGMNGEICIRGKKVFKSYLGRDRSEVFDKDGWFRTGDIGWLDDDSYLHVVGRRDDMFISGGENIHPAQIEKAALAFPGVTECAVIGVEDRKWGARPVLFVCHDDSGSEMNGLHEHLNANLPDMFIPKAIIELDQLPRTSIGKIDRKQLHTLWRHNENT
ncbi:MAG: o-succinylbenzoate--CoA ligase [candidate division Zixibacteria bacterium]|nr:o-succinylbenzoate--CoA ligase [candidate division Zixibacteria bacterium]MBU1469323.1 o-succinylbenzoate--CoA ligase [candidate division Zixibacteria bacterium]MBU2626383.1 o-succinylbenzoate--CoA ligase [candidate division Zixibacteria bacterium]